MIRRKKILFFSRGLGLGHATRDIQIKEEIQKINPSVDIIFASYQSAYKLLAINKCKVVDLKLPATGDDYRRLIKIGELIRQEEPNLIVSDEELVALLAGKIFNIPSILVTNYFPDEKSQWLQLFVFADKIVFPDFKNFFKIPKLISSRTSFVGPIIYKSSLKNDKVAVRKSMGIKKKDIVIVVTAGGGWDKSESLYDTAIKAFRRLLNPDKKLILLAGGLKKSLHNQRTKNIFIKGLCRKVDKYFIASDFVITRGSYTTLWELAMLGIPSISIPFPFQMHPFNEFHASNMRKRGTTIVIKEADLSINKLLSSMTALCNSQNRREKMKQSGLIFLDKGGDKQAAKIISDALSIGRDEARLLK